MKSKNNSFRPVLVLAPGVLAGAEKVVLTGIKALAELGLNPLMIIIRETRIPGLAHDFQNALPASIESVIIDSTKAFDLSLPGRLKDVLKKESLPVVLHSHGFKALIACYLAKGKYPHLHTHHGNTGHTFKVRIYEKIAMRTMKKCHKVIAVSSKMHEDLSHSLRPYNKISIVENMLSLANAAKIRNEREQKSLASNRVINLIFVGRLSPEKGLIPFLECFEKFPLKEKFHLTILGDGVERPLIESLIQKHNLSNSVKLNGFVADPSAFFIAPDILIMPSLREGLPMTLIEALASGIPVIANNVGAITSLVRHGQNGFIASNTSLESWTEVLTMSLENYKLWQKNAALEAEKLEERFSANRWAQRTLELYQLSLTDL